MSEHTDVDVVRRGLRPHGVFSVGGIAVETLAEAALDRLTTQLQQMRQELLVKDAAFARASVLHRQMKQERDEAQETLRQLEANGFGPDIEDARLSTHEEGS